MNRGNILVVEDERIVARDIQTTLQRAGYQVTATVTSGTQAVRSAAETEPDLVLMDVVLAGDIDGIEAARQIRQRREVPIVYLTANGDRAVLEQAKSTEPIAFILKPYDEQELLTTIEMALHQYRAQQQRAREALAESETRYRELFETARDGIAIIELAGRHLECNRAYLELLGYATAAELRPFLLAQLAPPQYQDQVERSLAEARERGYSDESERECMRKDGTRVAVSVRSWLRRDRAGLADGLWVLVRDISERKLAEQRIAEYQTQLRALMQELSLAEERERQRIATDIHDRISQTLAVCQMRVEALAQAAPSPEAAQELGGVGALLEQTLQETSSLTFELCPPVLHQLGLAAALEWFGERLERQHGLKIEIRQHLPAPSLTADQRTTLFRATCELMNNVGKHARASHIQIALTQNGETLQVIVEDDGIGLGQSQSIPMRRRNRGGFGLFHVRERLRAWGGSLTLGAAAGGGTCARLALPLNGTPLEP